MFKLFNRDGKIIHRRYISADTRDIVIRRVAKRGAFNVYRLEDWKANIHRGAASIGFRAKNDANAVKLFNKKYAIYRRMLKL